jgi:cellulose synthase/poly-beta-1,6-N-acetylglucosamine synthase-like glycosyltransferase
MTQLLLTLYIFCTFVLAVYTLGQLVLLLQYLRHRQHTPPLPTIQPTELPAVTVQLPVFNERSVVSRLLNAITDLDYPREKLHIQILDDSTDSTTPYIAKLVESLQAQGWQIQHLHRTNRSGYKAGALANGLQYLNTDYVAIFDADFVPPSDFLQKTLPFLVANAQLGVVQTAWGHLNADTNWLTKAQRLSTDAHFVIEQTARSRSGWIVPFNGTGGVWRIEAIHSAGGWSSDTLTEDCDLSYRAQLKGWQALYLNNVIVPGELPPQIAAYRQQQARWAQGNTQCLKKILPFVLTTRMPLTGRIMAIHHLFQYVPQLLMLISLLTLPPILWAKQSLTFAPLGLIGLIPPMLYVISQRTLYPTWKKHLVAFPFLALIATGLIARNSFAVLKGLVTQGGVFKRTPKFADDWQSSHYALRGIFRGVIEWLLMGYALFGVWIAWRTQPQMIPYLLFYVLAFGSVAIGQLVEQWQLHRNQPQDTKDSMDVFVTHQH